MRNDKLIPGLILVLIGATILLANFGYINFHWGNLWHLWPMFLIIGGVNLVFAHNRSPLATVLKISVVIIGFCLLLFGNFNKDFTFNGYRFNFHDRYGNNSKDDDDNNSKDDDDDDDSDDNDSSGTVNIKKVEGNSAFTQGYTTDAKYAQLNIDGGGTQYVLNDTTNQLFKADTKEYFGRYDFSHHNQGSTYVLDFSMKDKKGTHFNWGSNHNKSNAVYFKLNVNPVWDINVQTGATALNFDLSNFKIRTLKLDGGFASLNIKMGQPQANTAIQVSTGVSSVNISIPKNAACRISTDSGLSSTNFDGFTKTDDGNYETPGFNSAKNKMNISISGGISDFNVTRY